VTLALAILLLGLGLAFIVAEVLFPSLGVLSFLAAASIIGSITTAFGISTDVGINFLMAVAVLVPAMILLGLKLFPKSPIGKHMVVGGLSHESSHVTDARDLEVLGKQGVTLSPLRPAGMARIDGRRVDVVSRGELIDPDTPIKVIDVRGNRVVVARIENPSPTQAIPPGE
jgi:membrane-bound serine protease (ClpP class)